MYIARNKQPDMSYRIHFMAQNIGWGLPDEFPRSEGL